MANGAPVVSEATFTRFDSLHSSVVFRIPLLYSQFMKFIRLKDAHKSLLNVGNVDMFPERCQFARGAGRDGQRLVNLTVSGQIVQFTFANEQLALESWEDLKTTALTFGDME